MSTVHSPQSTVSVIPGGNLYDKYHAKNPLYKHLVNRFLKTLSCIVMSKPEILAILEVGCGNGYLLNYARGIRNFSRAEGVDINKTIVEKAKKTYPDLKFFAGSVYGLNYADSEFDLVLACEVLEHLENPDKALDEIKRVAQKYCIISVPREPLWRVFNIARGAYIFSLGNTPGHIQHWGKKDFLRLLEKHFSIEEIYYPLPWQMALCRKN